MALVPSSVASSGKPLDLYFALKEDIPTPQVLSQSGNTISLSGGGGAVNVASATAVALSTQKLTATTYDTGFNSTNIAGQLVAQGNITSAPSLGQGTATLNGGLAEVTISAVPPMSLPKVRFEKSGFPDATIEYTGAAFTFNPPLTDSDFQTLSIIGNNLTISGGNTVDLSGMPVITALQTKTQNITAIPGVTDVSGELNTRAGDLNIYNGMAPSVNFFNSGNVQAATVDYAEVNNKLTMVAANVSLDTTSTGFPRVILDTNGVAMRADDRGVKLERYDASGATVEASVVLGSKTVIAQALDVAMGDVTNVGKGTVMTLDDGDHSVLLTTANNEDVKLQLKNTDGGGGQIVSSLANVDMSITATGGYSLRLRSDGGNIEMTTVSEDTGVYIAANNGTASISINDSAGNGIASMGTGTSSIECYESPARVVVGGPLQPNNGIRDSAGVVGTVGQVLSTTGVAGALRWVNSPAIWASHSSTVTQTVTAANTTTFATFNSPQFSPVGLTVSGNSFTTSIACRRLIFHVSVLATSAVNNTTFRFFARRGGVGGSVIANSCSTVVVRTAGDTVSDSIEVFTDCTIGTIFQFAFQANDASGQIVAVPVGGVVPNEYPATPSIAVTAIGFV